MAHTILGVVFALLYWHAIHLGEGTHLLLSSLDVLRGTSLSMVIYPSRVPQGLRGLFPNFSLGLCGSTAAFCASQCWVMFSLIHHNLIAELHI